MWIGFNRRQQPMKCCGWVPAFLGNGCRDYAEISKNTRIAWRALSVARSYPGPAAPVSPANQTERDGRRTSGLDEPKMLERRVDDFPLQLAVSGSSGRPTVVSTQPLGCTGFHRRVVRRLVGDSLFQWILAHPSGASSITVEAR